MARPLRIEFEGALYHVTSRGNGRAPIFRDDNDFQRRMDWLFRTVDTYGWLLHAFVLMSNHDHLFVETPQANLSAGMQYLNGSYSGYFNARHRRTGHVFGGRYKGILIEQEGHYDEISRYIHLNPVRAGMVSRPQDWRWGSFPGYSRRKMRLPWVTYSRVLAEFGTDELAARRGYRRFIAEGLRRSIESPLESALHGLLLGSDKFADAVRRRLKGKDPDPAVPQQRRMQRRPSLDQIREVVASQWKLDPKAWINGRRSDHIARASVAYLARCRFGYTATQTARALGYAGPSSVNMAIRRIQTTRGKFAGALGKIETALAHY